jgi:hypothetical protein
LGWLNGAFVTQSNAGQIREELLSVINRGTTVLVADMTAAYSQSARLSACILPQA